MSFFTDTQRHICARVLEAFKRRMFTLQQEWLEPRSTFKEGLKSLKNGRLDVSDITFGCDIAQFQSADSILCVGFQGGVATDAYFCFHLLGCIFYREIVL